MARFFVEIADDPAQNKRNARSLMMKEYTMAIFWLDHVNIRTAKLDEMSAFYEDVLGLPRGKRPSFPMGGAWHYCGKQPVVHLVEASKKFKTEEAQIEHFALRSNGTIKAFQKKMRDADTPYEVRPLTEINMVQVNVFDPDGNKIEVQFAASKADTEGFEGSASARRRLRKGQSFNTTRAMPLAKSKSKVSKTNKKLGVPKPIKSPKKRFAPA